MILKNTVLNDFYLRLVGIPLLGFLIPPIFFHYKIENAAFYWRAVGFSTFYTILYWQICRAIFIKVNARFPDLKDNKKRLTLILVSCFIIIISLCNFIHLVLEPVYDLEQRNIPPLLQINAASFVSFIAIAGMYESMRYSQLLRQTLIEKEQLAKANLQSQLDGLKSQVNPHFLFNSLNTLTHLIPENPENAVRFVQKMSKVYRYILEMRDSSTTPLSTELVFLEAYIFLLKERFGDNFRAEINKNTEGVLHLEIIPLSLQIVVENAIKHNIISTEKPLLIEVFIENNNLIVRNNLQRKNQVQIGTGTGLENIKNRYILVSDKTMEVIVTPQYFTIVLPLL
ncbi:MAG: histidine kinase [Saprospiraceae bacterium]|nr:histidine kinase [Saprospiraceae bacterium]